MLHKKNIFLFALAVLLTASFTYAQDAKPEMKKNKITNAAKADKNKDGKVFVCKSCGAVSDKPGTCEGCGGKLHEMSVGDAEAVIHEHHEHHSKMMGAAQADKNKDGKVYQCPMCADQISDSKGECKNCGMELKETSVEDADKALMSMKEKMEKHKMKNMKK